jgi:PKD repeat protein
LTLTNSTLTPLITGVTWEFGDNGQVENGSTTIQHVYTRVGEFPLKATVRLNDGRSATATTTVVVLP